MLTELELRGCDLRVIPDDAFYGVAQHLALLDLGNNGLQRIPKGALAPLKKLRYTTDPLVQFSGTKAKTCTNRSLSINKRSSE